MIPEMIIDHALKLLGPNGLVTDNNLWNLRKKALEAIADYKVERMRIKERDKQMEELRQWLKENNVEL